MGTPSCGLCGIDRLSRRLSVKDYFGRLAHLAACDACGLVQVEERPDNGALENYYSRYCYENESAWLIPEATRQSLRRVARSLERYRRHNTCLEVGCGAGTAMRVMAELGWEAEGTELSTVAARKLEAEGFRIHTGAIEDVPLPAAQYDVIILSEVIEHLRDPQAALAHIREALRPGGAAYITTPNFNGISRRALGVRWRVIDVPEHLFYFTVASLAALLQSAGLSPLRIVTEGINPYELWGCLRAGRTEATLSRAKNAGDALREAATQRGAVRGLKAAVNGGLRLTRLGDTLKAIAERPRNRP